jgi:2-(1,2-epoxy-1,2-dihydrophenyl)acetyl-CoA isomerase
MLDLQINDGIAWLTLERPAVLNAINQEMANSFLARIKELEKRSDVRAVITRGEGRAFCAGSDLRELAPLSAEQAAAYELGFAKTFSLLDRLAQPTIAALHGHVLGGGLGLALYHDFRIASETASLGMPEVELGWTPPWAMGRLADVVGFQKARWILINCATITGVEAANLGIVDEAVPDDRLLNRAEKFARHLASMPPEGITRTKMLLDRMSPFRSFEWDVAASEAFRECYAKPEAQKKVADFVEKKKRR